MRILPAAIGVFLVALGLRLMGNEELAPTLFEAKGLFHSWLFDFAESVTTSRAMGAFAGALASVLLVVAFRNTPPTAAAVGLLAAADPLGVASCREAGSGGMLSLAATLAVFAVLSPTRHKLGTLLITLLGLFLLLLAIPADRAAIAALPPDPTLAAWSGQLGFTLGILLMVCHHAGYALVPTALAGVFERKGKPLLLLAALGVCIAFWIDGNGPVRLSSLAVLSPILVAMAGLALEHLRSRDNSRLAMPGLMLLILVVNLPVLISDIGMGQRFPWAQALEEIGDGEEPLYTTTPEVLTSLTEREVRPLPDSEADVMALLSDPTMSGWVLLPCEGGQVYGTTSSEMIDSIEKRQLSHFEATASRYDLYRFEVRGYRLPSP